MTNRAQPSSTPRTTASRPASGGRPYKALIVLYLAGGADSWNLIVPHSGCSPGNVSANYETYQTLRGGVAEGVALTHEELLPISVPGGAAYPRGSLPPPSRPVSPPPRLPASPPPARARSGALSCIARPPTFPMVDPRAPPTCAHAAKRNVPATLVAAGPSQPCSTLGVRPRFTGLQRMYNDGDAALYAAATRTRS